MRKKYSFWLLTLILGILILIFTFKNYFITNNSVLYSWAGKYYYEEYLPPNMGMTYLITIYEDDGLFAYIKIDGFQTLKRLKAKVWSHEDELIFEFLEYYTDDKGKSTIYESYYEGDILLKLKRRDNVYISEWCKLQPMITEGEDSVKYFTKYKK